MPRTNPVLERLAPYPTATLEARREALVAAGRPVYDFGIGDPPDEVPAFIREALAEGVPVTSSYGEPESAARLRDAIRGYVARRFGVSLVDDEVLATAGGKEAALLLALLVAEPGGARNAVAFPDPGYPGYASGAAFAGAEAVRISLSGDFHLRLDDVIAVLPRVRLVWVNSPHNPTGATLDRDELRALWQACRAHDVLLVSDECYADVYAGAPPPSILEIAREGVLAVHSLSKRSGMTGYRAGFVAGDPVWIARLAAVRSHVGLPPQDFVNAAAAAAWDDDAHAAARRVRFAARRRRVVAWLDDAGFEVTEADATFYVWARARDGRSGDEVATALLDLGILVSPGGWFGPAGEGYVRFAVCPDDAEIDAAIAAWHEREGA